MSNTPNIEQILETLPKLSRSELRRIRHELRRIRHQSRKVQAKTLTVEQKMEMSLDEIISYENYVVSIKP